MTKRERQVYENKKNGVIRWYSKGKMKNVNMLAHQFVLSHDQVRSILHKYCGLDLDYEPETVSEKNVVKALSNPESELRYAIEQPFKYAVNRLANNGNKTAREWLTKHTGVRFIYG